MCHWGQSLGSTAVGSRPPPLATALSSLQGQPVSALGVSSAALYVWLQCTWKVSRCHLYADSNSGHHCGTTMVARRQSYQPDSCKARTRQLWTISTRVLTCSGRTAYMLPLELLSPREPVMYARWRGCKRPAPLMAVQGHAHDQSGVLRQGFPMQDLVQD